ncbi:MAG: hypothetical protein IJD50_05720 [Clostridia bacterium]|nr:hypothetical protein [Clostridia bacterium]
MIKFANLGILNLNKRYPKKQIIKKASKQIKTYNEIVKNRRKYLRVKNRKS